MCWGSVADFRRRCFLRPFWIIVHIFASHYYYSNLSIDLIVEFSKCYLLGQFELTESTECNRCHIAMGTQPRPPQRKTLLILFLISASLWGCLGCQISVKSKRVPADFVSLRLVWAYQFVINITLTQAQAWVPKAVSAICWGCVVDSAPFNSFIRTVIMDTILFDSDGIFKLFCKSLLLPQLEHWLDCCVG